MKAPSTFENFKLLIPAQLRRSISGEPQQMLRIGLAMLECPKIGPGPASRGKGRAAWLKKKFPGVSQAAAYRAMHTALSVDAYYRKTFPELNKRWSLAEILQAPRRPKKPSEIKALADLSQAIIYTSQRFWLATSPGLPNQPRKAASKRDSARSAEIRVAIADLDKLSTRLKRLLRREGPQ